MSLPCPGPPVKYQSPLSLLNEYCSCLSNLGYLEVLLSGVWLTDSSLSKPFCDLHMIIPALPAFFLSPSYRHCSLDSPDTLRKPLTCAASSTWRPQVNKPQPNSMSPVKCKNQSKPVNQRWARDWTLPPCACANQKSFVDSTLPIHLYMGSGNWLGLQVCVPPSFTHWAISSTWR